MSLFFGSNGDPKLIVSLRLGSSVTFKWKAKSCSDSEASSCWLHHGDLLVIDGQCQDEYPHGTSPSRWIRYHIFGCPLAAVVLGSFPTCAHVSPVLGAVKGENPALVLVSLGLLVVLVCRLLFVLVSPGYRLANHWWVEPFSPTVLPCETALARFLYLLPISGILGRKGSVWCT